jgi:signal transduction histidine kinase/CheY-like chemotaxis protein
MAEKVLLNRLNTLLTDLEKGNDLLQDDQFNKFTIWSWECDNEGIITDCTPQVRYILGVPPEDLIGQTIYNYRLTPDSANLLSAALRNGDSIKDVDLRYITELGDVIHVRTYLEKVITDGLNENPTGWRGTVHLNGDHSSSKPPDVLESAVNEPDTSPINPHRSIVSNVRGKPFGFYADPHSLTPAQGVISNIGAESVQNQRVLYQNGKTDDPAVLAVPKPYGDGTTNLLLEILDNKDSRQWSEDEIHLVEQVADQLTLALENAQLFEQIQSQAEELSILRQVSLELAREQHDLRSVIEIIIRRAMELLASDGAVIWLANETDHNLEYVSEGFTHDFSVKGSDLRWNTDLAEIVFINGRTQITSNYVPWVGLLQPHNELTVSNAIAVPLIWQTEKVGVLLAIRRSSEPVYSPNERHLADLLAAQAAAVIQNARLFVQTQKALEETEILYQASAELNACESFVDILEILQKYTVLGENPQEVSINIYDRPWVGSNMPDWYDQVAISHSTKLINEGNNRFAMTTIPSAAQLLSASALTIIEDITRDIRLGAVARETYTNHYKANCLLFAPLVTAGQWIGHITGIYKQPTFFSESTIRRLTSMTGQAAFAVQNLRLLEETRLRADELLTAAEIARDTTGTLSLDILLSRSVDLIRERFRYYHATIYLIDDEYEYAYALASTGGLNSSSQNTQNQIRVGSNSIIGYVTQVGEPLLVNDVSQDPLHQPNHLLPDSHAELGIPLKIGDRVIGALDVQSIKVNAFTENDLSVLQILADQIAIAVGNARAYELSIHAMEEMRKADQLKSQFLANMSHELRTPLNSIIGFSRVIIKGIDGPINEVQEQDLKAIYSSGQHLLNLINDILDLSKIEAGKMELAFEDDVSIDELIDSVMSTTSGLVKDKPIEIITEVQPDLPKVRADPLKIRQVLLNLISNAAKFTEFGSITIKAISENIESQSQQIKVSVVDSGAGIAKEDQKKLFLPFSQVDASPSRKTGGSGLGLSICRHLIEMHRGEIGVESELGKGSSFYFTLPIPMNNLDPKAEDLGEVAKTILCVNPDRAVLNVYERYLTPHGYQIIPIIDLEKAINAAISIQPQVITLDIVSGENDGFELLKELKANQTTQHIPVIICSIQDYEKKATSLGADAYLSQPILRDDLLDTIKKINQK